MPAGLARRGGAARPRRVVPLPSSLRAGDTVGQLAAGKPYPNRRLGLTGENLLGSKSPPEAVRSTQPGGRAPAPGRLAILQAFINSHYDLVVDPGADLLCTPAGLRSWLAAHGLASPRVPITAHDLERALAVREGLRQLLAGRAGGATPSSGRLRQAVNRAIAGAALELRFSPEGPELVPTGSTGFDRAVASLVAIAARAMIDGSWRRLKVCPGRHCGWVFYDHSRNNSGRWCSMNVCGGREKARAHYRRQRGG
jgi:predicted RNA-binding Zn ribbon-like protein